MQKLFFLSALSAACLVATHATAQGRNCGERAKIVEQLAEKYGETPQSVGLGTNNGVVETFASDTTGTWTILMTMPNGTACLMAAGEAFEQVDVAQSSLHDGT